ncbi:hypothetical protein NDU88_000353 [Pleurodeles waltl]|uniref:Uncharacterized protein n=1 Tax=Pleurodeles waltl TaxID=8319 RepID=A0AAV7S5V3_PLEWA|nr:hypothetical protein NDU88_000353 [Pleurodeles waltl]
MPIFATCNGYVLPEGFLAWNSHDPREVAELTDLSSWEACALSVFKRRKRQVVCTHFTSLAVILAKQALTLHWKAPEAPPMEAWCGAVWKWGVTEGKALHLEEARRIRRGPVSRAWDTVLIEFNHLTVPPTIAHSPHLRPLCVMPLAI